jgi:DNA polymerase III epsilon subunit family exonuclease
VRAPARTWARLITGWPGRPAPGRWSAAAEPEHELSATGSQANALEPVPRLDEQEAERYCGDRQCSRLLPGLLPAAPFLAPGDVVVVDVETTGWLPDAAGITEIGAVRFSTGRPASEFCALVNPGRPIPPSISDLTGITDAMVSDAPTIAQVLPEFLQFASGGVIVAHNAPFDLGFLAAACHDCGVEWPDRAVIDTAVLSRLLLGRDVPDHRLATLSAYFDVRTRPCHRALADAKATAAVLKGLLGLLARGPRLPATPPLYQPTAATTVVPGPGAGPNRYDVAAAGSAGCAGARSPGPASGGYRALARPGQPARVPGGRPQGQPAGGSLPRASRARDPRSQEAAMVTAIVLIKADVARIPETAEEIAQIPQVSEVYSVTGEFDLVAMVRVRGHEELGDVIPGTVNKVPGVTHTETHIAFRTYSRHDLDAAFSIGYPEAS